MITGPYNSVRGMADGDPVKVDNKQNTKASRAGGAGRQVGQAVRAPPDRPGLPALPGPIAAMNKFIESAFIALAAIWSSKLRSLMTVLGNIVAVTSIIAVVSLIQGLNASVKSAILNQAGADSFNIQQFPITRSDEEFGKRSATIRA